MGSDEQPDLKHFQLFLKGVRVSKYHGSNSPSDGCVAMIM